MFAAWEVSGYAGIFNGCDEGKSRYYCCPTGSAPSCEWKGTAPFCGATSGGRCSANEVEITTSTSATGASCWTGHKSLCCARTDSDKTIDQCEWFGSAPFCTTAGLLLSPGVFFTAADCSSDFPIQQTTSKYGYGGEQPCLYDGGWKSYCCKDPDPWKDKHCKWHQGTDDSWYGWPESWLAGGLLHGVTAPIFGTNCHGECPAGQVPIATDGTSCQPGTYSYYCCDNPNAPLLPAPGDVSLCPSPPGIPVDSSISDPDGDGHGIYGENDQFDQDCTLYGLAPLKASTGSTTRDLHEVTAEDIERWMKNHETQRILANGGALQPDYNWEARFDAVDGNRSLTNRDLHLFSKRTFDKNAVIKFCAPGAPQFNIYPQTYPGFRTIAKLAGKGWITIAKPAICGAIGVTSFATQPANTEFVTEHVFEKQSLRDYLMYMTNNLKPGGGQLTKTQAVVKGIFDQGGIFFDNWPASITPGWGRSPVETAFGALGHAEAPGNYDNLQVCDRGINQIKALITAIKAFKDPKQFASYGPLEQTSFLADVIDTFSYMKLKQTVESYNAAYKALIKFWGLFAKHPNAQAGYDYVGAFKDLVSADLDLQVSTALSQFKVLAGTAKNTWGNTAMTKLYSSTIITANQKAIDDFLTNVATYINYDKTGMLAP